MTSPLVPTTVFFDLGDTLVYTDPGGAQKRFEDTLDTLQVLQARGYRIGLLSNQAAGTSVSQVVAKLAALGLAPYVEADLVTISTEIAGNVGKPSRAIFDLALSKAGHAAPSDRAIFITEESSHVAAARGFGWRAMVKRNAGACLVSDGECVTSLAALLQKLPPLGSLSGTNLDLAPPARRVDGRWCVPIDISKVDARLVFDASTNTASGDASITFKLGRHAGCPVFDLRQTITGVWLDGVAVPTSDVGSHDFGGGADASMRVLHQVLDAGSAHVMRLTYNVGMPQSSMFGTYLPSITWGAGPRLAFNFGFTDLGAGRYLEAFAPANLLFDQFEIVLDLQILNTTVAHQPISNGVVTGLGSNHWQIRFPAQASALSPMLEVRAADALQSSSHNVTLPVSGRSVDVTAWKLSNSAVDTTALATTIAGHLADNELSTGPYMHGNRFVAFVAPGGMEYDGGTTSAPSAVGHETFHSWWGRGIKPAGQPHGWLDEAWTVYHQAGASAVSPFNFSAPPITLCSQNPWSRVTAPNAYSDGERFWKGMAALLGAPTLRNEMNEFYRTRGARPVSTGELEAFLVARTGNPQCVDAFHRFVYGLPDPSPQPDLWLRDDPAHLGQENWSGRFWDSPDLWVRHHDDGELEHQNPEYGQDNWLYARVRNLSATAVARHFVVAFNVKSYAGTQFVYPADFLPATVATAAFDLGPNETRIVKARWPRSMVPPVGAHPCLLAAVFSRFDQPVSGKHVFEQNNLAQKNLTIVDLAPNTWIVVPVQVINLRPRLSRTVELELARAHGQASLQASLLVPPRALPPKLKALAKPLAKPSRALQVEAMELMRLDCGSVLPIQHETSTLARDLSPPRYLTSAMPGRVWDEFFGSVEQAFDAGTSARLSLTLQPLESLRAGLRIKVPTTAVPGTRLLIDLTQRESGKVVGGIAVAVNVI